MSPEDPPTSLDILGYGNTAFHATDTINVWIGRLGSGNHFVTLTKTVNSVLTSISVPGFANTTRTVAWSASLCVGGLVLFSTTSPHHTSVDALKRLETKVLLEAQRAAFLVSLLPGNVS